MTDRIPKAFVSFRISTLQWLGDKQFEGLLSIFEKYKGVTDEITFFLSVAHSPANLDYILKGCDVLAKRMDRCRQLGYSTGINILCTTGHHEENLAYMQKGDYHNLTNLEGKITRGAYCSRDQKYREEYVKSLYEYMAKAKPDYIWIDDDVRLLGHLPITETCFCDNCLKLFSEQTGRQFTRESLREAFNSSDESQKLETRKAWIDFNRQTITSILEFVERTVHAADPDISLGFMDGARFYEGLGLKEWAEALGCKTRDDVMWRPGAGTYNEESPSEVFTKAHVMGLEGEMLPQSVTVIESELESFPYPRLAKSEHYTALEADVYTAAGCTGTAFNILTMGDEPLDDYDGLVKKLHANRPFLDLLAKSFGRASRRGIFGGHNRYSYAVKNFDNEWFGPGWTIPGFSNANQLYMGGLPAAYSLDSATAVTLTGDCALTFSEDELIKILSGGVYMDGAALMRLNEMGYLNLTGFSVKSIRERDTIEKLNSHALNETSKNFLRDARQSFWQIPAYCLEPSAGAEILAYPTDYTYEKIDECCAGIFENELGGRICAAGYCPWEYLYFGPKMRQIKNVFRWLSRNTLNAYIDSYHRISMWDSLINGKHVTSLVNGYLDAAENVELILKSDSDKFEITDMYSESSVIDGSDFGDGYRRVVIPAIAPWQMVLIREL